MNNARFSQDQSTMKKVLAFVALGTLFCLTAMAQRPNIISLDKNSGAPGEILTINGSDFGTDPNNVVVSFGAVNGTIKSIGNQLIEVFIPTSGTFDYISVTRKDNRLSAFSPERFFVNYSGEHGLNASKFASAQVDFDSETGLYDLCTCDLNNDGKTDVATAGDSQVTLSIFENGSTVGTINLDRNIYLLNAKTLHVNCGDLNGDGLPELVLSQGGDLENIFVLRNQGNFSFTTLTPIKLTGRKVKQLMVADMDLDGKSDIVVTDKGSGNVAILRNQSTLANISFASAVVFATTSPTTDALDVADLNGDRLPEIITSTFSSASSEIYILVNKSSPGSLDLSDEIQLNSGQNVANVKAADLDGDSKPDIIAARLIGNDLQIFRNTSSENDMTFAEGVSFLTQENPWGIGVGDLDGDGKTDLVVTSIAAEEKSIVVYNNRSTSGNIAFEPSFELPTTYITRNIRIADMDSDAKPDIVYTSVDDNVNSVLASKVSIIRNVACMVPQINPKGPLTICTGVELPVSATAGGVSYEWKNNGATLTTGPSAAYTITTTGNFTVTAVSEGGACERTSNIVEVTVAAPGAGLNGTDPNPSANGPVCVGNSLELEVADVGATAYNWSGPENFTATGRQVSLNDFQMTNTGLYTVQMMAGQCVALIDSVVVEGIDIPEFEVSYSGDEAFCDGLSKILTVTPQPASNFGVQWAEENSGDLNGQTNTSLTISNSGTYRVKLTPPFAGCTVVETDAVTFEKLVPPVASFEVPELICLGTPTLVTNLSTVDSRGDVIYQWVLGTDPSALQTPEHTFNTPGNKNISLEIHYDGVSGCSDEIQLFTEVVTPVTSEIVASAKEICAGDTSILSIDGAFESMIWSTQEESDSIFVVAAGTFSVTTTDANGCEVTETVEIDVLTGPEIAIVAEKSVILLGESITLEATGGTGYIWIGDGLDKTEGASVIASPQQTTTYHVSGESLNTPCSGSDSLTIEVLGERIAINPPAVFTPNNDGSNEEWVIPGVLNYGDCTLNIFDSRGRRVYEKTGYQNDWKGTYNGNELPAGVYYFVFSCPDKTPVTGTVSIVK